MEIDYTDYNPDPIDVLDIVNILKEWEYELDYSFIPEHIKDEMAVKLFTNTPASGDKGIQDDIIEDLCDRLRIDQLYNMGLISNQWIRELYQEYLDQEDDY